MHKFASYFSGALLAALLTAQAFAEQPTVQGGVAWRFEVLANYISHRADVARDGTVYFNDSSGFLYALTPAGALNWVYDGETMRETMQAMLDAKRDELVEQLVGDRIDLT